MAILSKSQLAAVGAASTAADRPALNGLHVEPDGSVVATDGHVLVHVKSTVDPEFSWPENKGGPRAVIPPEGLTIPTHVAKAALKSLPKRHPIPALTQYAALVEANGNAALSTTDLDSTQRHEARAIDLTYPNVQAVIPKGDPIFSIAFNLALMERLCATLRKVADAGRKDNTFARFDFHGPMTAASVTLQGRSDVSALIMPCNLEHKPS